MPTINEWGALLAQEIEGWHHDPLDRQEGGWSWTRITHTETGAGLHVGTKSGDYFNHNENVPDNARLTFSGCWPDSAAAGHGYGGVYRPYETDAYHCTCAANRTPEAIARTVTNRIIHKGGYIEEYLHQCQRIAEAIEQKNAMVQVSCDIAQVLDSEPGCSEQHSPTTYIRWKSCKIWGEFAAESPDSVHIELRHVPADVALEIAELLKEAR